MRHPSPDFSQNYGMPSLKTLLFPAVAGLVAAGILIGCGGSSDASDEAGTTGTDSAKTIDPPSGTTGPASAGDSDPDAPDKAIGDRPGGPNQGGNGKQGAGGSEKDGGSGGQSGEAPAPPDPY